MMKRTIPLLLLVLVVGCRTKLNVEKTYTLSVGSIETIEILAIKSAQTVNVTAKGDGKFKIYLFLAKDRKAIELDPDKKGANLLDHKKDVTEATLSGTVPADEEAVVMIYGADTRKVEVKVKIFN
jgi:hypothetical protein